MFIQLDQNDCKYLLDLIHEVDLDTRYTEKQRAYTVPKLQKIFNDPGSTRLAYQDVEYLLDLIEDDELPEAQNQRQSTKECLLDIQNLQNARFDDIRDIDNQRASRRAKRLQGEEK